MTTTQDRPFPRDNFHTSKLNWGNFFMFWGLVSGFSFRCHIAAYHKMLSCRWTFLAFPQTFTAFHTKQYCWVHMMPAFVWSTGSKLIVASSLNLLPHISHSTVSAHSLSIPLKRNLQQPVVQHKHIIVYTNNDKFGRNEQRKAEG